MNGVKYDTYYTFMGWEIRGTNPSGKHIYLKSIYKGGCKFVTDYLYAKHYASERTAQKIVDKLNERNIV